MGHRGVVVGGLLAVGLGLGAGQAAAAGGYGKVHSGEGTFYSYGGGGGGNCSFPKPDRLTAAMNHDDYAGSQACGACILVTNPANGKSVEVRIDDQCPECAVGDVDLDQAAFAQIAELQLGRIPIEWEYVACTPPTLSLYFKEGSSQWWTAVQVRDHRYPVVKLAWRTSGSQVAYTTLPRETYNYFVAQSGMGVGPYDFKITDVYGHVVKVNKVALRVGVEIPTKKQFEALAVQGAGRAPLPGNASLLDMNPPPTTPRDLSPPGRATARSGRSNGPARPTAASSSASRCATWALQSEPRRDRVDHRVTLVHHRHPAPLVEGGAGV